MTSTTAKTNPFLSGNFAPVREEIDQQDLKVIGELPSELSGMFVRNGPNPQFLPIGEYHWFDGDGMLHGVRLENGRAHYRNRYVRTKGFLKEHQANQALWSGLLEPFQNKGLEEPIKNTANTALVWHAQKLLALWEGGAPHAIALPSLDTLGRYTFNGKLTSPFTAHPKVDPETGEMLFFGYQIAQTPYLQYSIADTNGNLSQTTPIDLDVPVMMHDFAITKNYTIFMDFPLTFRYERMERGEPGFWFERDRPSWFGIMPRYSDQHSIRWFQAPAGYASHVLNAYENGDEIVLIACRMNQFNFTLLENEPNEHVPYLHQWRFNLTTGEVKERNLSPISSEFPQINEQYTGAPNRYGFSSKLANPPMPLSDGLIKFDFETEDNGKPRQHIHHLGDNCYCGEAVFAPRNEATAEDDGWLLTLLHDENQNQSELLVVDAQQLEAEPVARVILPQRVPYGFHAAWISESQLQATSNALD